MSVPRSTWGWAVVTAATGTVLIGIGAFWLSFMALADLAARSGIAPRQAWIWPLLVDGQIVVSTIAVVALDGRRGAWYPWALLICGALVSVAANALPAMLAATVAAVPPLVLLASTHLTVVLTRSTTAPPNTSEAPHELLAATEPVAAIESEAEPDAEPEAELVLGRRERAARLREAGWSNKAIADELGVHASTVGRWFTPPVEELEATTEMETTS